MNTQLTLSLLSVPGVATLPTLTRQDPEPTYSAPEDFGPCREHGCVGRLTRTVVTTSPALVGFARVDCPVCGIRRVL